MKAPGHLQGEETLSPCFLDLLLSPSSLKGVEAGKAQAPESFHRASRNCARHAARPSPSRSGSLGSSPPPAVGADPPLAHVQMAKVAHRVSTLEGQQLLIIHATADGEPPTLTTAPRRKRRPPWCYGF